MSDGTGYFNEIADQWDRIREEFFSEAVREKAYQIAGVSEGERAADIGAGTGFMTEGLLKHGLSVTAVDQSTEMLDVMREKFSDSQRVDYRLARADDALPLQDGSVDHCFANMYLHHVASPGRAIKVMAGTLRDGGRLVVSDLDAHDHKFLKEEQNDRWMGFQRDDIQRWFEEAGLEDVTVSSAGEDCCGTACDGSASASISIFVACGTR